MATHSSVLAWEIHGQRSLVGYSPWGRRVKTQLSDFHFTFKMKNQVLLQEGLCLLAISFLFQLIYFFFKCKGEILIVIKIEHRLPRWLSGKGPICQCRRYKFNPQVRKIPWRRKWQPAPVLLPGESPWLQRSPVGYSPQGCKALGTTKRVNSSKIEN